MQEKIFAAATSYTVLCPSYLHQCLSEVQPLLNELSMLFQEGTEEETEVLDKILLIVLSIGISESNIGIQRKHLSR